MVLSLGFGLQAGPTFMGQVQPSWGRQNLPGVGTERLCLPQCPAGSCLKAAHGVIFTWANLERSQKQRQAIQAFTHVSAGVHHVLKHSVNT
jgi:hypothetical protein